MSDNKEKAVTDDNPPIEIRNKRVLEIWKNLLNIQTNVFVPK